MSWNKPVRVYICRRRVCKELRQNGRVCQDARKSAGEWITQVVWSQFCFCLLAVKNSPPLLSGIYAFSWDLHGCLQKWHWIQPAGTSDCSSTPKQQIHTGNPSRQKLHFWTGTCPSSIMETRGQTDCFGGLMCFFPASSGQKEWAGQTTKRGQGAVAERAKENGELTAMTAAFWIGPRTHKTQMLPSPRSSLQGRTWTA